MRLDCTQSSFNLLLLRIPTKMDYLVDDISELFSDSGKIDLRNANWDWRFLLDEGLQVFMKRELETNRHWIEAESFFVEWRIE